MARIVLADDGIRFDGRTLETSPLGGVESSVVFMTRELARRGHDVLIANNCEAAMEADGVQWTPIHTDTPYGGVPETADLYIANRGDKLLPLAAKAKRRAFWIHNPANYLLKWRYISKLWQTRPVIVFIGAYHATTCPGWVPDGGRTVIPYGIPDEFIEAEPASAPPPPRAVFTSNPLRSLDWLLERWAQDIQPNVPGAELHVFSGAATYGSVGDAKAVAMERVLDQARELADQGVVLRGPVPKAQLIDELRAARVMLYRGDVNETFCLAVGEAQAMGVPAVVQDIGSMSERVIDGKTGYVTQTDTSFSEMATGLLRDEALWLRQHEAALIEQRLWGWAQAATAFEDLIE